MNLSGRSALVTGGAGGLGAATVEQLGGGRVVSANGVPHDMSSFARTTRINATGTFNVSRLVAAAMAHNGLDDEGQRGQVA